MFTINKFVSLGVRT